ncbi:MAG: hypothetical protein ACQZ3N_08675 [cyanobacterium endosymbiont of Rhopalodia yunnanensis]
MERRAKVVRVSTQILYNSFVDKEVLLTALLGKLILEQVQ